jgi:hypothetical protein
MSTPPLSEVTLQGNETRCFKLVDFAHLSCLRDLTFIARPGNLTEFLVVLLSPSRNVSGYYLKLELDGSFPRAL